jgi:CubicO group peptidase (beta-lactamase class C family)
VKYSICLILVCSLIASCVHRDASKENPALLQSKLEELRIKYDVPGASIAIISEGKILSPISLGWANLKDQPVTSNTLFQACSMTKTLTAALVLMEFERRHLSLDTPVNQLLKRWKIPANKFANQVTTRMLLNHTAAISNPYPDGGAQFSKHKATLTEQFLGQAPALNSPLVVEANPGTKYSYCNGCFSVLQMLIEDITGRDYRDLVKENLLDPIGMKNSTFGDTLLDTQPANVALNYDDNHKVYPPQRKMPIYATGSLWTTADEMALFIREVQKGLAGKSFILSQKVAQEMVTPSSTPTRGLGFFIGDRFADEQKEGNYFFHGGQNIGYLAMMIGSLDGKSGAVVMINISSPWGSKEFPHFGFVKEAIRQIAIDVHPTTVL